MTFTQWMVLPAVGVGEIAIITFVVGTVVSAVFFGLYMVLFPERGAVDRLESMIDKPIETDTQPTEESEDFWQRLMVRLGEIAGQGQGSDEIEEIKEHLRIAGYRDPRALEITQGFRLIGVFAVPLVMSLLTAGMSTSAVLLAMFFGAAAGYYGPKVFVERRADARQAEIIGGFPDALDLLISCMEAGMGMDQAFRRVANELVHIAPQLAREFIMVNAEVTAGVDRITALKHLEERTGLEDVRSLVNMLAQADRYGTSVADALRIFAEVAREKRVARAEEKAGQVGSKVTLVMIIFFLPVLFVVLIAPSIIKAFS